MVASQTTVSGRPKKISHEQIIESALSVMAREGFGALGLRSLARELKIHHTTLYNYFDQIEDIESAAIDELMKRVPRLDRTSTTPMRQQLIEHLLCIRKVQLIYPKFCHAAAGTTAWRRHMKILTDVIAHCCDDPSQAEDVFTAYNALISVVASNAERTRSSGNKTPIIGDLEAIATLSREEFGPMFQTLKKPGGVSPAVSSLVYRLDDLITRLMPHVPALDQTALEVLHRGWRNDK